MNCVKGAWQGVNNESIYSEVKSVTAEKADNGSVLSNLTNTVKVCNFADKIQNRKENKQ